MLNQERVIIENVTPELNNGVFFIKRIVNEKVNITADIIGDGHDIVQAGVRYKHEGERSWKETRMHHINNDSWNGCFTVEKQGYYSYQIQGWIDYALNWQHGTKRKIEDNQNVKSELLEGREYLIPLQKKASTSEKKYISKLLDIFQDASQYENAIAEAKSDTLHDLFYKYPSKGLMATYQDLKVYVDREKARFSTWYEFFPRSAAEEEGKHGTFKDCERLLPRIVEMGFDVLYFPPIHPIGEVNRKGKNNTTEALKEDVGSPWGIGSIDGGHTSIHKKLGSLEDFKNLVAKAKEMGLEIAMDYALQAAPDHPWVKEFPEFFKWRPDGTVQYAENPPKKYQDIQPIYFDTKEWKKMWKELLDAAMFWIEECDIKIFRVDNPHTKPFHFWGWLISEIKKKHPDVLFLSEAFTKPKVMQQLAKQGFTQSYTYFTWRNSKHELIEYVNELTSTDQKEYFRPNFWPNTPDINPYHLQGANEAMHIIKYSLASTLSSNTGIYGPVFEQMVSSAIPGKEEYLDSEKYQLRHWDWNIKNKLITLITSINHIRKENPALQQTNNIKFCHIENDQLIAFYKYNDDKTNEVMIVINLDPHYSQQGHVQLPLHDLGIHAGHGIEVHDLITKSSYHWNNEWNFVELHPAMPMHIFKIKK
ncbi:alpha-1,4-glucan--maltose-1-phosphate maltosyltransferase [Aquimarina sp. MMG016]|uniref:alpha-1,4-glucan--maltose-1-phosphate maltosyltransferase n=1 Tax=Aquimarina sp. MMG016 TaxID=2822690 RepID=UPI001B3A5534|nr:alpha-1,4-glucan--maltose-1-phosphate maltosyltransferase [Aquimarina sp. MMG016]MBQ4819446.1 alpha-1,4-glucan--maltose-1-phosphate maltosyltransferase [Aquimarina sp. MMG016]